MKKPRKWNRNGQFTIADDKVVVGDLRLSRRDTSLTLYSAIEADFFKVPMACIQGTMFNLTKVSLLHCVQVRSSTISHNSGERHASTRIIPEFIAYGDVHLSPM